MRRILMSIFLLLTVAACTSGDGSTETSQTPVGGSSSSGSNAGGPTQ